MAQKLLKGTDIIETNIEQIDAIKKSSLKNVSSKDSALAFADDIYMNLNDKKSVQNNIVSEEKKEIFNCIEKEEVVDRVLEMLKNNKVTPINVVDILEDLSVKKRMLLIK